MSFFKIIEARAFVLPIRARMPFRFGIAEMDRMPHVFIRLTLEKDGRLASGFAAEHLVPKWFSKNPDTRYLDDVKELREVVLAACRVAEEVPEGKTPFLLWWEIYHEQMQIAGVQNWPPLLASLGSSLIERALIDAVCRLEDKPFAAALRGNSLGIDLGMIYSELRGRVPSEFLPTAPSSTTRIRHTVGLSDPLVSSDLANGSWPDDGLPVCLEDCIRCYGVSSFKIKISGDTAKNIDRLREIAIVLERNLHGRHTFTLDGNESYRTEDAFENFWGRFCEVPELREWSHRMLFVEQPFHRDVALRISVKKDSLPLRMIIDESDATIRTLPLALECGYLGTTHKNCKGVFKSIANLALLKSRFFSDEQYIFSGEDLTNIGPVALLEDLCVAQNLGLDNIERNGHHYFNGLSGFPESIWEGLPEAHPDLYEKRPNGCPRMRVEGGVLRGLSLHKRGLGPAFELNIHGATLLEEWNAESLQI